MREVSAVFEKGFLSGLRPEKNVPFNTETLIASYNLVPNAMGLTARELIQMPFPQYRANQWPFPFMTATARYVLLFTETELFLVSGNWQLTPLYTVPEWGGLPHFADFMQTVIWSTPKGQWMFDGTAVSTDLKNASFKTCCNFKGQLIVANCKLPDGPEKVNRAITMTTRVEGPLTVGWSKIGSLDWEYTLGNEVGWAPMNWMGEVRKLMQLGDRIVVYGSDGVAKMKAVSEPVTAYGLEPWGSVGLLHRDAIAGDSETHLFIGTDKNLYMSVPERPLSSEGKQPARLGYKEFIQTLEEPIVTYDPIARHWWIAGKNRCFIFTTNGLGESSISPTGIFRLGGELFGQFRSVGEPVAYVATGPMSLNSRGIKTLMVIESDTKAKSPVVGQVAWKKDYYSIFQKGREILLDPRGFFSPVTAGVEFILTYRCETFEDFQLSKLWIRYKRTDKHSARGVIDAGAPEQ